MNIVILTNTKSYPYHTEMAAFLKAQLDPSCGSAVMLDINSAKYPHQCLQKLNALEPDIIITLDLAGFHFKTQSGENALNMQLSKNLNLVWGDRPEYAPFLSKKISLSMLFYDVSKDSAFPAKAYPNALYVKSLGQLVCSCKTPEDIAQNKAVFELIWKDFLQETLLTDSL